MGAAGGQGRAVERQGGAGQGRAGQGRAGQGRQGRAGQGRAGQGRAGQGAGLLSQKSGVCKATPRPASQDARRSPAQSTRHRRKSVQRNTLQPTPAPPDRNR